MQTSLFDLTGHVALVTGGNSGIGLGMAEALAQHGASVAIWGTNPAKNAAAAERLRAIGNPVLDLVCDVGDHQAVIDSMQATVAELGRLDSCFVNAGVGGQAPSFAEMSEEEWHRVLRVNLDGAFYTAQEAVKHMKGQDPQGGSIVFTTSGSAFYGQQRGQHYGGSKAAINAMMKGIAVEHARHGIRCNSVLPGWVESDMTAPALGWDTFVQKVMPRIPMRRWGVPADFGGIAVYLASRASSWHTGDIITLDGGYHSF
ncbi:MAG: SDR family oxidoreductase [Acidimicrobiaceae bacterium]|nr:SDR family oxidoreductase [Acidimicrobiaceae bacterium]